MSADANRRDVLAWTLIGAGALAIGCAGRAAPAETTGAETADPPETPEPAPSAVRCEPTSGDIEGPFYVAGVPVRSELDLYGDPGRRMHLSGRVVDASCAPIVGAVVELWHCDASGAYDNTSDAMRYRGQVATDASGAWAFHTLEPGRYLNGPTYRPAHVHIKVWISGAEVLTTQLYFDADPYNAADPWYAKSRSMAVHERADGSIACEHELAV